MAMDTTGVAIVAVASTIDSAPPMCRLFTDRYWPF